MRILALIGLAALLAGCGAGNKGDDAEPSRSGDARPGSPATEPAPSQPAASLAPSAAAPAAAAARAAAPLLIVAPPENTPPMPAHDTEVCGDVLAVANEVRARGERFIAISAAAGGLSIPEWSPLDDRENVELIVDGLYDGWCDDPIRVNPESRAAFSDAERAACRDERKARIRATLAGEGRLESAQVDIDRDGAAETVYQYFPDPASAGADEDWILWNLAPRIFVSPADSPEAHRQLHRTLFAPVASLFYREGKLYALAPMSGSADRYQIFLVMASAGRLGQIPLCELWIEGE